MAENRLLPTRGPFPETARFEELVEDWEFCFRLSLISPENQVLAYNAQVARQSLIDAYKKLERENVEARQILIAAVDRDINVKDTLIACASVASNGIFWRSKEITDLRADRDQLTAELSRLRALVLTAEQANAVLAWCYNSLPTADLSSQSRDRNYGLAALRRMANEADPAHSAPAWSEADV